MSTDLTRKLGTLRCFDDSIYNVLGENVTSGPPAFHRDFPELKFAGDITQAQDRLEVNHYRVGGAFLFGVMNCKIDYPRSGSILAQFIDLVTGNPPGPEPLGKHRSIAALPVNHRIDLLLTSAEYSHVHRPLPYEGLI